MPAAAAMPPPALSARELVFVTGKGGVGKTTVAAALGLVAARTGRATVVCELTGQERLARTFGVRAGGGAERALAPRLDALTIDPDAALVEWIARNLGRPAAALLGRSQAFAYLIAAAPGARELVTLGKAWDLSQGPTGRLVIVDGPSTGHALALLQAPSTYADMAAVSPVGRQAADVRETLRDASRSAVVLVAAPTEMAVAETIELADGVERLLGRPPDLVVMNEMLPDRFTAGEVERVERLAGRSDDQHLRELARLVAVARHRARAQAELLWELRRGVAAPIAELPFLFVPALGRAELATLATMLGEPAAPARAATPARRRPRAGGLASAAQARPQARTPATSSVDRTPTGRPASTTTRCVTSCSSMTCTASSSGAAARIVTGSVAASSRAVRPSMPERAPCRRSMSDTTPQRAASSSARGSAIASTTTAWMWCVAIMRATITPGTSGEQLITPGRMTSATVAFSKLGSR